jgi:hypothetical protein
VLFALSFAAGCAGTHSASGFRLPESGDFERGKQAFLTLKCFQCHSVDGVDLPAPRGDVPTVVKLGGTVTELRTDGYLVTSMIHPSHRLARYPTEQVSVEGMSRMPDYADSMTVRNMIDLVAFLQARYRYVPPPTTY